MTQTKPTLEELANVNPAALRNTPSDQLIEFRKLTISEKNVLLAKGYQALTAPQAPAPAPAPVSGGTSGISGVGTDLSSNIAGNAGGTANPATPAPKGTDYSLYIVVGVVILIWYLKTQTKAE